MNTTHRRRLPAAVLPLAWALACSQICVAEERKTPEVVKTIRTAAKASSFRRVGNRAELAATIDVLKPIHTRLGKPKPGDWLDQHEEPGQTFRQYLNARPVTPTGKRTTVYVQPLGEFSDKQLEIVELSAEFLGIYFGRPVKILKTLPPSTVPASARRVHPQWKVKQILSTHVLDKVLKPRLPGDAAVYIAFTSSDLWPGRGWNFVFGQASLRDRVGVWSIARNGDPEVSEESFRLCLRRTVKTATHETGHMFSIRHCTAYECNMCGSNNRVESDRLPLYLCPECHAKVCWAINGNPIRRLQRLSEFCKQHGFEDEQTYFDKAAERLRK